ncbi:TetR family transcriptional regulator [Sphaerisporangium krabiense]|nr:TetR family transcriptional regulator [Sphaerisporangium krabiense]
MRAAHDLFVVHGYAGATFQHIADSAGVSVQTVYFHYGSKSKLLKEVIDTASVGDDAPVALLDRPEFTDLAALDDAEAVVQGWVETSAAILDRVAPVLAVVRDAAGSDPDMAAQWAVNSGQRRAAHEAFVAVLTRLESLRPGLTAHEATDITIGLLSPELFLILTRECAWPTPRWQSWTTAQLAHALLRPA